MAKDTNLQLADDGTPLGASGSTTAIECEGGFFAVVRCYGGTITDANETFDLVVEASVDDEATFGSIGAFPQVDDHDDLEIARVVYVPPPILATPVNVTHVRITWVAGGTTPSWPVNIFLEPLVSLAAPEIDVDQLKGLCELKSA